MKYPQLAVTLAAFGLLAAVVPAYAQDTGFKGFLQRTGRAVMGQPATTPASQANASVASPTALAGTVTIGNAVTDGRVYRPISPATGGAFEGIFNGYSIAKNVPLGRFPRVALTFETFGASAACWRTRATIWTSATKHHEETFDLCNAPLVSHDDLGQTTVMNDPALALRSVIQGRRTFAPGVTITNERTTGPNPPAAPFDLQISGSTPNARLLRQQFTAILARAMVISGYVTSTDAADMRSATLAGSAGQMLWVAGFTPGGNRDEPATP